jgi:hypothetical protein
VGIDRLIAGTRNAGSGGAFLRDFKGEEETMKKRYKMFVFGETLQKAIDVIPEADQLRFYRIISQYGINGIEPELSGLEAAVWVQMKDMIDNTMPSKRGAPEGNRNAKQKNNPGGIDLIETNETIEDELNCEKQKNNSDLIETNAPMYNVNENVNVNKNEKENGNGNPPFLSFPPSSDQNISEPPGLPDKNYAAVFEKVKAKWKDITGQETRDSLLTVSPVKRERFIRTLANYSLEEIFNAIGNYRYVKAHPDKFDIGGRTYGNLYGFLENGVNQFFQDEIAEGNFRRKKN